ncbi:MAG: hypothetical protein JW780_06025 [Clostridiales bacterium]|nr:hypothetical protein [Clostridiales bacterium]
MIYIYKGLHGPSKCELEIYEHNGFTHVVFTELKDNPGTSITNFIERLATSVYRDHLPGKPIEDIVFVEHYMWPGDEHYDSVSFDWNGQEFKRPVWKRIQKESIGL